MNKPDAALRRAMRRLAVEFEVLGKHRCDPYNLHPVRAERDCAKCQGERRFIKALAVVKRLLDKKETP